VQTNPPHGLQTNPSMHWTRILPMHLMCIR